MNFDVGRSEISIGERQSVQRKIGAEEQTEDEVVKTQMGISIEVAE